MDLHKHYNRLYKGSINTIKADNYDIDSQIDSDSDNRFGITLLIRPSALIKNNIQGFIQELKEIDPEQYYYPDTDIHITVMSIISCYSGFDLSTINIADYSRIIGHSFVDINNIEIEFRGITASSSAIMIQGFTNSKDLDNLRDNLRRNFRNSGLEQSIDVRYSISTAHSTVVRFRKKIQNKKGLIETLEKYRNHDFGKFKIGQLELVYNDWYQRNQLVKQLATFKL